MEVIVNCFNDFKQQFPIVKSKLEAKTIYYDFSWYNQLRTKNVEEEFLVK
jgi:hypothetical protein